MVRLVLLAGLLTVASASYKNPHYAPGHSTMVHLFEWKWDDIAEECETFLGPRGFGGIQVSPPNENVAMWSANRPWWERYQPISYKLITRSGDEEQFANMVRRCNDAGVRIYVDAIINHMSGSPPDEFGTGGSTANYDVWYYPAVPYGQIDFNWPVCGIDGEDYGCCADKVRNCELVGLKDLDQSSDYVRRMITRFMNQLIDLGVAGFRIDAAKHMWPKDLEVIYDMLNDLNTEHGFEPNSRPYIYQEVIDYGGEAISRDEYTVLAAVTEFKFGSELSNAFKGGNMLRWLVNWGPEWALLAHEDALTFIDNHDNQRGHGGAGSVLTYKEPKQYKGAIGFMLAHPYGEPQLMSSFEFEDSEIGPPMDAAGNIISPTFNDDNTCGSGWVCEHRWRQIYEMVRFRNVAAGAAVTNWWDNGSNQIMFCRESKGCVFFNNDSWDMNLYSVQTSLPGGTYCDVISGSRVDNHCNGKTIYVESNGRVTIHLGSSEFDMFIAIHIGPESRIQ